MIDLTDHIELASGIFLDVNDPDPADIRLDDVVHGLANTCRFAGHSRCFYSVAEHAVLVAWILQRWGESRQTQWEGLHHDDTEAYLGDVSKPLKELLPEYARLEDQMFFAIDAGLDLGIGHVPTDNPAVRAADHWALSAEAYHLLPSKGAAWFSAGLYRPGADRIVDTRLSSLGCPPEMAKSKWLYRYRYQP